MVNRGTPPEFLRRMYYSKIIHLDNRHGPLACHHRDLMWNVNRENKQTAYRYLRPPPKEHSQYRGGNRVGRCIAHLGRGPGTIEEYRPSSVFQLTTLLYLAHPSFAQSFATSSATGSWAACLRAPRSSPKPPRSPPTLYPLRTRRGCRWTHQGISKRSAKVSTDFLQVYLPHA